MFVSIIFLICIVQLAVHVQTAYYLVSFRFLMSLIADVEGGQVPEKDYDNEDTPAETISGKHLSTLSRPK